MFEWLKKKEAEKEPEPEWELDPAPEWGSYEKLDYCNDCESMGELDKNCCPKCGGEEFTQVIVRWEYILVTRPGWRYKKPKLNCPQRELARELNNSVEMNTWRKRHRYEIKTPSSMAGVFNID